MSDGIDLDKIWNSDVSVIIKKNLLEEMDNYKI